MGNVARAECCAVTASGMLGHRSLRTAFAEVTSVDPNSQQLINASSLGVLAAANFSLAIPPRFSHAFFNSHAAVSLRASVFPPEDRRCGLALPYDRNA